MPDEPYTGFEPLPYETTHSLSPAEGEALVRIAQRFMEEHAPLMAAAAGLTPNPHRRVDLETVEEGMGNMPHRIGISKRPFVSSFVVCPTALGAEQVDLFLQAVGPREGAQLVIAARSFAPDFRAAIEEKWAQPVYLLTMAGTERKPQYNVLEEGPSEEFSKAELGPAMKKFMVEMDAHDFMLLRTNEAEWAGQSWPDDRFTVDDGARKTKIAPHWKKVYFFEHRADVILARAFLRAIGEGFEAGYDWYEDDGHGGIVPDLYCIFTNYEYDK
jgi:hypothetical protein